MAQREKFATKQAVCSAWLNANRPSEKNGEKGTASYQSAQRLKRALAFSNVNQVLYKYMDEKGNIKLPDGIASPGPTGPTGSPGAGTDQGSTGNPGSSNPGSGSSGSTTDPGSEGDNGKLEA